MKAIPLFLTSILLLTLTFSCKKEVKHSTGGGGAVTPGAVRGVVKLRDETGALITSSSGIVVSILGKTISFTTLEDGKFTLSNIPAGTYNLRYSKPGFSYNIEQILITGNGTLNVYPRDLYQLSSEAVNTITFGGYDSATTSYSFMVTLKPSSYANSKLSIIMPYSTLPEVNVTDTTKKPQFVQIGYWPNVSFVNWVGKISVPRSNFDSYVKKAIYLKAFVTTVATSIKDPDTGLYYYTNFTDVSPEIKFVTL